MSFREALDLLDARRIEVHQLISHHIGLGQLPEIALALPASRTASSRFEVLVDFDTPA